MGPRRPPRRRCVALLAGSAPPAAATARTTAARPAARRPTGLGRVRAGRRHDDARRAAATRCRPRLGSTGVVATGLEVPWGLAFLPDGSALVSERDADADRAGDPGGRRQRRRTGRRRGRRRRGRPARDRALAVVRRGPALLFAYFTSGAENVVARLTLRRRSGLSDQRTVFDGIPAGPIHNGGRIAFGPDGLLYVGTGEAGRRGPARRTAATSAARSCGSRRTATRRPATRSTARRSGAWATATCRAWPGTRAGSCGPRSSARTPGTS